MIHLIDALLPPKTVSQSANARDAAATARWYCPAVQYIWDLLLVTLSVRIGFLEVR
jgi:hypothetical protein